MVAAWARPAVLWAADASPIDPKSPWRHRVWKDEQACRVSANADWARPDYDDASRPSLPRC